MNEWPEIVRMTFDNLANQTAEVLPRLLVSLVLVAVGVIIAYGAMRFVRAILRRVGLDRLADQTGFGRVLAGSGYENPASHLAGFVVFWAVLAVFLATAADALGLPQVSVIISNIISLLPPIALAALVLLIGFSMARTTRRSIEGVAERSRMVSARPLGAAAFYLVAALTTVVALSGLGVDFTIVTAVVSVILAAFGTGLAVMLGVGARDVARNTVDGVYVRRDVGVGDRIRIGDLEGRVTTVGQVTLTLEHEGRTWLVPYDRLLGSVVEILERAPVSRSPASAAD